MKKLLDSIDRGVGILSDVLMWLAGIGLVCITLVMTVYVIDRWLLDCRLGWAFVEEWGGYIGVMLLFFALGSTERAREHINVDVVIRFVPQKAKKNIELLTTLVALAVTCFLFREAMSHWLYAWETQQVSNFPSLTRLWIPTLFMPLGLIVLVLELLMHTVHKAIETVRGYKTGVWESAEAGHSED